MAGAAAIKVWKDVLAELDSIHTCELARQRQEYEQRLMELTDENAMFRKHLTKAKNLIARLAPSISLDDLEGGAEQCQANAEAGSGAENEAGPGSLLDATPPTAPGTPPPTPPPAELVAEGGPATELLTAPTPPAVDSTTVGPRPQASPRSEPARGPRWLWEVVGGDAAGGIPVREREDPDSPLCAAYLAKGALVEEVSLSGKSLQFRRLTGIGPKEGWVFTEFQGRRLAVRADRAPLKQWQPPPATVGPRNERPLPIALVFNDIPLNEYTYKALVTSALPAVREALAQTKRIFGFDFPIERPKLCSQHSFLLMFLSSLAGLEQLRVQRPEVVRRAAAINGVGTGQYVALVATGVLSIEDALNLLKVRYEIIPDAMAICKQGTTDVTGIDLETLWPICLQACKKEGGPNAFCQVATYVASEHFWVCGSEKALGVMESMASKSGARVKRLLPFAPHSRVFKSSQAKLESAMYQILPNMKPPVHTIWMNTTAEPMRPGCDPTDIVAELKSELVGPGLSTQCSAAMQMEGISEIYHVTLTPWPLKPVDIRKCASWMDVWDTEVF